jgi:hypothetical protein
MVREYLKKIAETTAQGDAREESYYNSLSDFLCDFAQNINKKNIQITILPKKTEAGNPDFRVWDGKQHIVGYIEAKKPGERLDDIEESEQLLRYRSVFPNLILTDFYEYRLYRNGKLIDKVFIGRSFIAKKLQTIPPVENEEKFYLLLKKFFSFILPKVFTAESLAGELAKRTRFLKDEVISKELEEEEKGKGEIYGFYLAFKKFLVANLELPEFADIYSQTITYGLFAARTRANSEFNRKLAYDLIPNTIGILKNVFKFISLGNLSVQMEVIIDDISEVLQAADVNKILNEFYRNGKGEDPIVHFYETFLNEYDPETKEKRGVYYTPEPVVKYIIRAVHYLLKTKFKIADGIASNEVTLLDPAAGTLTFPAEAIKIAVEEFENKFGNAGKELFIRNHILKNFYAFELMMAPYAIGHIKMSFLLEELGYIMKDDERFKLYLTNTLDMEDLQQTEIPGLESLSTESHYAANIKKNEPILVIIGNPPYSGHSANRNEWTNTLLKEEIDGAQGYYTIDGESLNEKNSKWLQDDYVKFLRFAQWKIHKAGLGIVGMITNHSYLDNPTFRGMRQSLMNTFNEIYLMDLHGNSLKKEMSPDGSKDENVFDIRQGVAIAVMIKKKNARGCKVYHKDLFGLRKDKYDFLEKENFIKKDYELLDTKSPTYFFIKRNTSDIEYYNNWHKINEIFPVNSVGIVTARDEFAIAFEKNKLKERISQFRNLNFSSDFFNSFYNLKSTGAWDIEKARSELFKDNNYDNYYYKLLYRPFDERTIYYSPKIVERMRYDVMRHMLRDNLGLITVRQVAEGVFNHCFITDCIVESRITLSNKGIGYLFPLYLYPEDKDKKSLINLMLFDENSHSATYKRKPNISQIVFDELKNAYNKRPSPEEILYYVYAVMFSNIYREKFSEFLKVDFPRIPFTRDYRLFEKLSSLGKELTELHLLKHRLLNNPIVKYRGKENSDIIKKIIYSEEEKTVHINDDRYFDNVTPQMWNYFIGGYKVMEKYLKLRIGRQMDSPQHYTRLATSIALTIDIQKEIDKLFPNIESSTI